MQLLVLLEQLNSDFVPGVLVIQFNCKVEVSHRNILLGYRHRFFSVERSELWNLACVNVLIVLGSQEGWLTKTVDNFNHDLLVLSSDVLVNLVGAWISLWQGHVKGDMFQRILQILNHYVKLFRSQSWLFGNRKTNLVNYVAVIFCLKSVPCRQFCVSRVGSFAFSHQYLCLNVWNLVDQLAAENQVNS